jgi:MscS family membrane protein
VDVNALTLGTWWGLFTETKFMSNELWRWGGLFALLLGALVTGKIVSFVLKRQAARLRTAGRGQLLAMFLDSLPGPISLLLFAAAIYLVGYFLKMAQTYCQTDGTEITRLVPMCEVALWVKVTQTLAVLGFGWFTFNLVGLIEFFLRKWTSRTATMLDDQLVPLIRKTLRVFVVIVAALFVVQNIFDQEIAPLIAGLGIGGLAIALAAKDTLANFFGSVTIFSDRPFQLGERIKVGDHDGVVEEVGFRSTRIRTLMGHQVIIPNSVMSNQPVENIGRRPYLKRVMEIGVTYDTSPDKLHRATEIIHEMLSQRSESFASDMPPRVYFSEFAASSLNMTVYYWFAPPDWWAYMQFNHDFNVELLRRFNEAGIEFAFPTQTVHVKRS